MKQLAESNKSLILHVKRENEALAKEVQRVIYQEAQSRCDNLIFEGIPESHTKETWADYENKIYELIQKDLGLPTARNIRFERVHRLGPYSPDKVRGIIAKCSITKTETLCGKSALI